MGTVNNPSVYKDFQSLLMYDCFCGHQSIIYVVLSIARANMFSNPLDPPQRDVRDSGADTPLCINASSLRTDPTSLKESRGDQTSIKLSQHPVAFPLGFCCPSISISIHSYSQLVRRRTVVVRFAYLSFVVVAAPPNCGLRFWALISTA
jgi:hypothetical protein